MFSVSPIASPRALGYLLFLWASFRICLFRFNFVLNLILLFLWAGFRI